MATFQDLQNIALWRLRQRGVNFGGAPNNAATDQDPPYIVALLLNMAYSEFLSRTLEAQIASLKIGFNTILNATAFPLNPCPAITVTPAIGIEGGGVIGIEGGGVLGTEGTIANPAAMRVLEATYTTQTGLENAGYEYGIELVSSARFAYLSGDYTRRLSYFGPRIEYAARLFRKPQLDVFPGCAVAGDLVQLTIVPDPYNSPAGCPATLGGPLVNPTDVPLFPQQFHMALVDYVVANAGDAANKGQQVQAARDSWERYVDRALMEGGTEDGGDPMRIVDSWVPPIIRDGNG